MRRSTPRNWSICCARSLALSAFVLARRPYAARPLQDATCLLVMPTGAGKSLCYQLPAIARGGTALVISPLIALMEDQAAKLSALGLRVARIHSGLERAQARQACVEYLQGTLQFLFIAPERLRVPGFAEMLAKKKLALIAIDEAHCISQWGHDFRPDYRMLGRYLPALRGAESKFQQPRGRSLHRQRHVRRDPGDCDDGNCDACGAGGHPGTTGNGAAREIYSWVSARQSGDRSGRGSRAGTREG